MDDRGCGVLDAAVWHVRMLSAVATDPPIGNSGRRLLPSDDEQRGLQGLSYAFLL
ncbi:hypothetical protein [Micropruina sp.]|uniref:hypothetical protein n=1 Tax=Micropruina sp. TaxID=2737536 RepID=UPI0039E45EDF